MTVQGFRVFDHHLHITPNRFLNERTLAYFREFGGDTGLEAYAHLAEDPANLLAVMDAEGIDRAGLINYVAPEVIGYGEEVNDWVADYVDGHRDRLLPIGGVHPASVEDGEEAVDRLVDDLGIHVVKIHPSHQRLDLRSYHDDGGGDGRVLRDALTRMEERGVPVIVHTGTSTFPGALSRLAHPMHLDDWAVDFPDLPIVVAHSGRPLWCDEAVNLARRHANVHLDLSSIPPQRVLHYLPRLERVAHKTLWGSDWPGPGVPGMGENVEAFLDLDLPEDAKRDILWGNVVDVLGGSMPGGNGRGDTGETAAAPKD